MIAKGKKVVSLLLIWVLTSVTTQDIAVFVHLVRLWWACGCYSVFQKVLLTKCYFLLLYSLRLMMTWKSTPSSPTRTLQSMYVLVLNIHASSSPKYWFCKKTIFNWKDSPLNLLMTLPKLSFTLALYLLFFISAVIVLSFFFLCWWFAPTVTDCEILEYQNTSSKYVSLPYCPSCTQLLNPLFFFDWGML